MVFRALKKILAPAFVLLFPFAGYAQKATFEIHSPAAVALGKHFRVEFVLSSSPSDFIAPDFADFDVLAGPSTSTSKNISIVNGSMTTVSTHTITYVLLPRSEGIFTIGAAEAKIGGKTYTTSPTSIEVVSEHSSGSTAQQAESEQSTQSTAAIAPDDIILRAVVDKTKVFKGEPVKVAFKLYYRVPIVGSESSKVPAFNGFWSQEVSFKPEPKNETYNNRVYETQVISEFLLFPQQAGTLTIEQFDINLVAQVLLQETRRRSLFDDFFDTGSNVQNVRRKVSSAPVKITVNELPAGAPAGFSGAVGQFTMDAQLPPASITANSSSTYNIKVSGTGNLPLVQAPKMSMPGSFEQYNIKTTESLSNSGTGISGYRQFEYPFIARAEGTYYLEPVTFTYFDPSQARYVTLSSDELELTVLPDGASEGHSGGGIVSGLTKEDLKILGQDIRFIKIGSAGLVATDTILMGSLLYFIILILLAAAFVFALLYLQKRMKDMRNTALVRGKRANKVALQHFKAAESHMKSDSRKLFYEEMLHALWGYMSNKLNIPVANLTKENVREELLKRGVSAEYAQRFIEIISECEYAQYSPEVSGQMGEVYKSAVDTISKFEATIKR